MVFKHFAPAALLLAGLIAPGAFRDAAAEVATPEGSLTLDRVLAEVAANNLGLGARRFEAAAARARVAEAGPWESPVLTAGYRNLPVTFKIDEDPMTMRVIGVEQKVPISGANGLSRRAALAAAGSDSAGVATLRSELFAAAWQAYADAYSAEELARAAEQHRGVVQRMVAAARARYESGKGRLDDLLRAQAEEARIAADAATFAADRTTADAALNALRGRHATSAIGTLAPPPDPELGADPSPWLEAVATHPRIAERRATAERFDLEAKAARRRQWPDLEVMAEYGFREPYPTMGHGERQSDMISATVGVSLPIYAGSSGAALARTMDAMGHAADAERRREILALEEAVTAAHARALAGRRIVRLLADTVVVQQRRALDAAWSGYSAGMSDLYDVFEIAHMLYQQEIDLAHARHTLAQSESQLLALTGRGDWLSVTLPGPEAETPRSKP